MQSSAVVDESRLPSYGHTYGSAATGPYLVIRSCSSRQPRQRQVDRMGSLAALRYRPDDQRRAASCVSGCEDPGDGGPEMLVAGDGASTVELQAELGQKAVAHRPLETDCEQHQLRRHAELGTWHRTGSAIRSSAGLR